MKIASVKGACVAAICVCLPSMAFSFTLKSDPKVAMIIYTQTNDGGWSQAMNEARLRAEKELGITIDMVDNVPESAAAVTPVVDLFVERGYNIILGSVYGYSDAFLDLSKKYPDVAFLNSAGTTNAVNLQSFYARTYQSQYLCGMAAGALSKTGKLGFVAANPIGLVNWNVNGYLLGARQINPDATLTVVFTGTWNDPVKERAAAEALIDQGIDVVGQHADTPTTQIVAEERGIYSTGHHRDLSEFSKATQCSSVWIWDQYLVPELKKVMAGNWESDLQGDFLSIGNGVDIACCGPAVPQDIKDRIVKERQALIDGKQIFAGPLKDTAGKERVAAGAVLSDADLWSMDWYVPGVISQR